MADLLDRGREGAAEMERLLRPIVEGVAPEHQPILLALLERNAAERYRGWAETAADDAEREGLLSCARREEQIADAIEALRSDLAQIHASLAPLGPGLRDGYAAVIGDRSRDEQMAVQAAAERIGAGLWRTFAEAEPAHAETFERCAGLEEASASFLEGVLRGR